MLGQFNILTAMVNFHFCGEIQQNVASEDMPSCFLHCPLAMSIFKLSEQADKEDGKLEENRYLFKEPVTSVAIPKELVGREREKEWMASFKMEEADVRWNKVGEMTSGSIF